MRKQGNIIMMVVFACWWSFLLLTLTTTTAFQTSCNILNVNDATSKLGRASLQTSTTRNKKLSFSVLKMSSRLNEDDREDETPMTELKTTTNPQNDNNNNDKNNEPNLSNNNNNLFDSIPFIHWLIPNSTKKVPPLQVEDMNVLLYDVFLIINLSLSISFWVTHRMSFDYLGSALCEGSLMSILWIVSGLYHGSFLYSAVDGHYGSLDEEHGGPKAAAMLAFTTYISAINLRLLYALGMALLYHRPVGMGIGEELIPIEIGFGLLLMSCWRGIHSYSTPRV